MQTFFKTLVSKKAANMVVASNLWVKIDLYRSDF